MGFLDAFFEAFDDSCKTEPSYHTCETIGAVNPAWMADVPGDTRLGHLTIPGTHDSAALIGGMFAECQSLSIEAQLNAGIRYLDIRLKRLQNTLPVFHGIAPQKDTFDSVLQTMRSFLDSNPSEGLLMRVREEGLINGDKSRAFHELINEALEKYKVTDQLNLEQIRGKVIVLQDFDGEWVGGAMEYDSMDRHSSWEIEWESDVDKKKTDVRAHLVKANGDPEGLYFTALSGTGLYFGGPKAVARLTNPSAANDLNLELNYGFGLVVTDYPGKELIERAIKKNRSVKNEAEAPPKGCVKLANVKDEVCDWYNPSGGSYSASACESACKQDANCVGYQFRYIDPNCDLIKGKCGADDYEGKSGDWTYVSKECFA